MNSLYPSLPSCSPPGTYTALALVGVPSSRPNLDFRLWLDFLQSGCLASASAKGRPWDEHLEEGSLFGGDNPRKQSEDITRGGNETRKTFDGWATEQVTNVGTWNSMPGTQGPSESQYRTSSSKLTHQGAKRLNIHPPTPNAMG